VPSAVRLRPRCSVPCPVDKHWPQPSGGLAVKVERRRNGGASPHLSPPLPEAPSSDSTASQKPADLLRQRRKQTAQRRPGPASANRGPATTSEGGKAGSTASGLIPAPEGLAVHWCHPPSGKVLDLVSSATTAGRRDPGLRDPASGLSVSGWAAGAPSTRGRPSDLPNATPGPCAAQGKGKGKLSAARVLEPSCLQPNGGHGRRGEKGRGTRAGLPREVFVGWQPGSSACPAPTGVGSGEQRKASGSRTSEDEEESSPSSALADKMEKPTLRHSRSLRCCPPAPSGVGGLWPPRSPKSPSQRAPPSAPGPPALPPSVSSAVHGRPTRRGTAQHSAPSGPHDRWLDKVLPPPSRYAAVLPSPLLLVRLVPF
jgi:hypothetical protein